jgi:hypothetical protein
MLESGEFATLQDLAAADKINASYVGRVLRLTLLSPEIVEAILDGLRPFPVGWREQRAEIWGGPSKTHH